MESEVQRLRRQSETMQLRRALTAKDTEARSHPVSYKTETHPPEQDKESSQVIHEDDYRLQLIKSRPRNLVPENMSYDDLEELKESHTEKLKQLKDAYAQMTGKSEKQTPNTAELSGDLTYEEMAWMRVLSELDNILGTTRIKN